jgi:ParB-like chromosome segregation protein Spo0J
VKKRKRPARQDLTAIRRAIRKRLSPIEEARIYARLLDASDSKSQRRLSSELGVSQTRISQRMALLEMPAQIVKYLDDPKSRFTERHARAVRRMNDPQRAVALAQRVVKDRLTVRDTEDIVDDYLNTKGISTRSLWADTAGVRWRRHHDYLELRVKGTTPIQHLQLLKRFLSKYKPAPRD